MEELLPIINANFTEDELRACSNGECCQCGLCCFTFQVDVPSEPGDVHSPLITKKFGQRCPQLVLDVRGKWSCLLQSEKKSSSVLSVCNRWAGNKKHYKTGRSGYKDMCEDASLWMLYPRSIDQVAVIRQFIQQGTLTISDIRLECAKWFTNTTNLVLVLKRYLMDFQILPHDIFSCIGIREQLKRRRDDLPFIFADIHFSNGNPLYYEFYKTYLSD